MKPSLVLVSPCRTCNKNKDLLWMLYRVWWSTEYTYLPGLHWYAGFPAGTEPSGRRICTQSRYRGKLPDQPVLQIRERLFLPGYPAELPDLTALPADLPRWLGRDRIFVRRKRKSTPYRRNAYGRRCRKADP